MVGNVIDLEQNCPFFFPVTWAKKKNPPAIGVESEQRNSLVLRYQLCAKGYLAFFIIIFSTRYFSVRQMDSRKDRTQLGGNGWKAYYVLGGYKMYKIVPI